MQTSEMRLDEVVEERAAPVVKGFRLLIAPIKLKDKTEGNVILPDEYRWKEDLASNIGVVVGMGDLAYKDEKRFPSGPWCKIGDFVLFRSYSGTRLRLNNQDFRILNDDSIEATIDDPRGYSRGL